MRRNRRIRAVLLTIAVIFATTVSIPAEVSADESVVIVIDPGHGGPTETGACYEKLDLYEKNIDLLTAKALAEELRTYNNVKVYLTREDDTEVSLDDRTKFAKDVGADLFVSVHFNGSEHHRYYGTEIFTSAYGDCYRVGHSVADYIYDEWEAMGCVNKGIKTRKGDFGDYYAVIRNGKNADIPAIILEHAYLDNPNDYEQYGTQAAWEKFALADATGIAKFYGLSKEKSWTAVRPNYTVDPLPQGQMARPDESNPKGVSLVLDKYDPETGRIEYTINAKDDESRLMYYGMNTRADAMNEDIAFVDLNLWDYHNNAEFMKGVFYVKPGYKGGVVVRVYNCYEGYTDSRVGWVTKAEYVGPIDEPEDVSEEPVIEESQPEIYISEEAALPTPINAMVEAIEANPVQSAIIVGMVLLAAAIASVLAIAKSMSDKPPF